MTRKSYLPSTTRIVTGTPHFEDPEMGAKWPALYELMTASTAEGNKFREPATLSIYAQDGRLKCCIFDKYTQQVWFSTLKGCERILDEIEETLQAGGGEWRKKKS